MMIFERLLTMSKMVGSQNILGAATLEEKGYADFFCRILYEIKFLFALVICFSAITTNMRLTHIPWARNQQR